MENNANTTQIDVYSVGLLFYEILTLKHPLLKNVKDPSNLLDWQSAHLYQPCPDVRTIRPDVPLSIAQLLSRMVAKRVSERPQWDGVLSALTQPEVDSSGKNATVTAAVEAAVTRNQELQRRAIQARALQDDRKKRLELYRYTCNALLDQFEPIVQQFNNEYQQGKIISHADAGGIFYNVPQGQTIQVAFFAPSEYVIKIPHGEVIGGGWIGLANGRSANLVLLKHGEDDLYGQWAVCEIGLMALIRPAAMIGQFGITAKTVMPFGFKDAYFYDQIQYDTGMLHVFTYTFVHDVVGFFAGLIRDALAD